MSDLFSHGKSTPVYGLPAGYEFQVTTASLGTLFCDFTFSAETIRVLVEVARHNPDSDRAILEALISMTCRVEPAPHQIRSVSLQDAKTLSDVELNAFAAKVLDTVPLIQGLRSRLPDNQDVMLKLASANKAEYLAHVLRVWLGEKLPDRALFTVHLPNLKSGILETNLDVVNAVVHNANTSVTVADLARDLGKKHIVSKVPVRDSADANVSHMVTEPGPGHLGFEDLLSEARKATVLQAKVAEMMVSLNNVIVTLSNRYTHDQTEAQKKAQLKDRRDFAWVRGALFVTVFLGVVSIGIAIAALVNDYAGGDEAKAEAKQTREAIEAASQAQLAALVKALQAIQDQQAGDAKLSRDQIQHLIDAAKRPPAAVMPAAPARSSAAKAPK